MRLDQSEEKVNGLKRGKLSVIMEDIDKEMVDENEREQEMDRRKRKVKEMVKEVEIALPRRASSKKMKKPKSKLNPSPEKPFIEMSKQDLDEEDVKDEVLDKEMALVEVPDKKEKTS